MWTVSSRARSRRNDGINGFRGLHKICVQRFYFRSVYVGRYVGGTPHRAMPLALMNVFIQSRRRLRRT